MFRPNPDSNPSTAPSDSPCIIHGPDRPDLLRSENLADLFEATADRVPARTALIFGEREISYGELDAQANGAASNLIEAGVRPGHIVGLWLPRGIELLVMQLAIAKTGAAWLPFDADTPPERIAACLDDADATGIVACATLGSQRLAIERPRVDPRGASGRRPRSAIETAAKVRCPITRPT